MEIINTINETTKYKRMKTLDKFVRKIIGELELFKITFYTLHCVTQIILTSPIWSAVLYLIIRYGGLR